MKGITSEIEVRGLESYIPKRNPCRPSTSVPSLQQLDSRLPPFSTPPHSLMKMAAVKNLNSVA